MSEPSVKLEIWYGGAWHAIMQAFTDQAHCYLIRYRKQLKEHRAVICGKQHGPYATRTTYTGRFARRREPTR